jgi:uncharacterized protein (TIGR01777 family)
MKIIITGGSGLIGRAFTTKAVQNKHQVIVLTRDPSKNLSSKDINFVRWDGRSTNGWLDQVESADAIINLAGANIGETRWTMERKQMIRESRLLAGKAVTEAIQRANHRPRLVMQASAVGYYGNSVDDTELSEAAPASQDYLGQLCVDWENSTRSVEELGFRRIILRTGLVLTKKGGALGKLILQYRLFAGGPLGSGNQWWPWIHLKDQVSAMLYLLENDQASGVYNLSAPNPVKMKDLGNTLAKVLNRPYWIPVPAFGLKILLGEMSKIVLEGQRAIPAQLLAQGYQFQYPDLEMAIKDILTP